MTPSWAARPWGYFGRAESVSEEGKLVTIQGGRRWLLGQASGEHGVRGSLL